MNQNKTTLFRSRNLKGLVFSIGHFLTGGTLTPGERHLRDTQDDGTVTLCTQRAATVLSRDCRVDFGRPLTKKVMSHSRDGPGARHPCAQTLYLSPGCGIPPPPFRYPPLKSPRLKSGFFLRLRWWGETS